MGTLQLFEKREDEEMGLAAGGKMKQKIYEDDAENFDMYNTKRVTRVFVNIANGNMWQKITGQELPESPLNPKMYKMYGYPWFDVYDDSLQDLAAKDELSNVKSIKEIENDPDKPWNCPICTFENVANNLLCCMCQQGQKPNQKKQKGGKTTQNSVDVDDGDW